MPREKRMPVSKNSAASKAMAARTAFPSAGAFSCVSNGSINNTPDSTAVRAALDALNGWDPTGGCLYYYNPKATGDQWIRTRTVKTVIGNHSFAV